MKLNYKLEQVNDQDSFFDFVKTLINDRKTSPDSWENDSIETYLAAALEWGKTTQMGQSQGLSGEPSWKTFAVFLYCGKIYE